MASATFPILFIAPGDTRRAVMVSGLIEKLREEVPGARFTLVVGAEAAPLFAGAPDLEGIVVLEDNANAAAKGALWKRTKSVQWGLTVDTRGLGLPGGFKTLRRAILTAGQMGGHVGRAAAGLFDLADEPPTPKLWPAAAAVAKAETITAGEGPILAVAPNAEWGGKAWPIERFSQVAIRLTGKGGALEGGRLMVLGGPGDPRNVEPITRTLLRERVIDLSAQTDLALITACLAKADLFVGNDTLMAHLAAGAGVPGAVLYGPSDETVDAPLAKTMKIVRGPRRFAQFKALDPNLNQVISHMMDLPADAVNAALDEVMAMRESA